MTKRRGRPNQQTGKLKALLLTGSVIATLAGMELLPLQDQAQAAVLGSGSETITVVVPDSGTSSIPLPPNSRKTQVELKPIPQAIQPHINVVTRTRSSR
ncbi:MAG: hypothetical protein WAM60_12680 [Candidatus Promineifilaceae bacterium]